MKKICNHHVTIRFHRYAIFKIVVTILEDNLPKHNTFQKTKNSLILNITLYVKNKVYSGFSQTYIHQWL